MRITIPAHVVLTDIKKNGRVSRTTFAYANGRFFVRRHGKNAKNYFIALDEGKLYQTLESKLSVFEEKPTSLISVEMFEDFNASKYSHNIYCCLNDQMLALSTQTVCEAILECMNCVIPTGSTPMERLQQMINLERVPSEVVSLISDMENNSVFDEKQANSFIFLITKGATYADREYMTRVYKFAKSFKSVLHLKVFFAFMLALNHFNVNRRISKLINLVSKVLEKDANNKILFNTRIDNDFEIIGFN